jgi:hypothetical protein
MLTVIVLNAAMLSIVYADCRNYGAKQIPSITTFWKFLMMSDNYGDCDGVIMLSVVAPVELMMIKFLRIRLAGFNYRNFNLTERKNTQASSGLAMQFHSEFSCRKRRAIAKRKRPLTDA